MQTTNPKGELVSLEQRRTTLGYVINYLKQELGEKERELRCLNKIKEK
jgi:hypothetical protein